MSKYLVTGGAGFIGSNIVERLVEMGEEVVVLDDLSTGYRENIEEWIDDIELVEGDIRDTEAVRRSLSGVDYVLHQAALASVPRSIDNPVLVNDVNVNGTLNVLEQSRKEGVKGLVYAASSSAYGDADVSPKKEELRPRPLSPYAVSKLVGEHYCSVYSEVYGLPTVSLRYFNVFGPRQDPGSQYAAVVPIFISRVLEGKSPVIYGDGEQSRDFTYVSNVVSANILAAKAGEAAGEMINVACGDKFTVNRLLDIIKEELGSDIEPRYEDPRAGDVKHSLADISKAGKMIDYSVKVTFQEGIRKTIDWYGHNLRS
ncbi:MAG: NAD-dependent epimerase/dehydratase family protein [Candidatus Latescibacteria bacterium]|nr:NAD-dependent epimerase/dehydratase family protein [bacterium]MBD3422932.1 NAD-dependent epimerase/dehydratase family protein [Candidatus Latescibacterota bacterium]